MDPMTLIGAHAALVAACKTGLLTLLDQAPRTAAQCAETLGLCPRATEQVLEVLASFEFVEHRAGLYTVGVEAAQVGGLTTIVQMAPLLQKQFDHTHALLLSGEPLPFMDDSAQQREASYVSSVRGMGTAFAKAAHHLANQLPLRPSRILDVGCGTGVWSLAIAESNPKAQVTGLDLPKVLDAFVQRAKTLNLEGRIETIPGDMHNVMLTPERFDLAVIANVLRLEAPDKARQLVARVAESVGPEGALLIVDAIAGGTPEKERIRATYALHLAVRTGVGRIHPSDQIRDWMAAAGFRNITEIDCGTSICAAGALLGVR